MPFTFLTADGRSITLDEDAPEDGVKQLRAHIDAEVDKATEPLQDQVESLDSEIEVLKGAVVDEIVRVRKLQNSDLDVEAERKHLETFDASQLAVERKRALSTFKAPTAQTEDAEPEDPTEKSANPFAPDGEE